MALSQVPIYLTLTINPRRIDASLFESEKETMAGWHEEQMEAEAELR